MDELPNFDLPESRSDKSDDAGEVFSHYNMDVVSGDEELKHEIPDLLPVSEGRYRLLTLPHIHDIKDPFSES